MFNLFKKNLLQSKICLKSCLFIIFIVFLFGKDIVTEGIYFLLIFGILYILDSTINAMDNMKKGNYIINSLPITRKEIVISKYLNGLTISIIVITFFKILSHLTTPLGIQSLSFKTAINILCFITLYNSINYVLSFSFDGRAIGIIKTIIYIIIWANAFIFFNKDSSNNISLVENILNNNLIIIAVVLIFITSILISLKIYQNKDL